MPSLKYHLRDITHQKRHTLCSTTRELLVLAKKMRTEKKVVIRSTSEKDKMIKMFVLNKSRMMITNYEGSTFSNVPVFSL